MQIKSFSSPFQCLALAWLVIAAALQISDGHFDPIALVYVVVGTMLILWAARLRLLGHVGSENRLLLTCLFMIILILNLVRPPGLFLHGEWYYVLTVALILVYAGMFFPLMARQQTPDRTKSVLLIIGVSIALGLRLLMPIVSPSPIIDVFPMFQDSARHFLSGLNPYSTAVSDVYDGKADFGYHIFAYAYLPLNLYFQTLSYWITQDVRNASVAADAITALCLYRMAQSREYGKWYVLLFLFMPRGLFTIEQAWTEPFIAALFGITALLAERRRGSVALSIAYGLMLSLKQYLVFFIVHGLMLEKRPSRIGIAAIVGSFTLLPFLIVDPAHFIQNGVTFQLLTAFRSDGLTISSALFAITGITINKIFTAAIGFSVSIVTFVVFRHFEAEGWRWATMITTLIMFLFGSQAFCNYYYFIEVLILFTLAGLPFGSAPPSQADPI